MLRANEIGADVHSTTETELDKNNLSVAKDEIEHRFEFPELRPGRALVDIETGALYEVMHRVNGFTDTVEGRRSESQEYLDWKYDTPKGQDWGGIIQHYYLSFAERQCPEPNQHGELQTPLARPDENSITDLRPGAFEENILFDGELPRPFLIVERPEVTYEELMPGDTFDILGWYDPSESDPDARIKPVSDIASMHPDIAGVEYTTTIRKELPEIGVSVAWDGADATDAVHISRDDEAADDASDAGFTATMRDSPRSFHISLGTAFGDRKFLIDSPYDAKEDIKDLDTHARWASDQGYWAVDPEHAVLREMVTAFTGAGWEISLTSEIIDQFGTTNVDVTPAEDVTVSHRDVFEYAFSEEIEISSGVTLPGVPGTIAVDDLDGDFVEFTSTDDGITVTGADEPASNHIPRVNTAENTMRFDCPKESAGLVKSLEWSTAKYEWVNADAHWQMRTPAFEPLITTFADNDVPVTATVDAVRALGDEETVTEVTDVTVDSDAVTGVESYAPADKPGVDVPDEMRLSANDVFGMPSETADGLSLMAIDMTLADTQTGTGMSVDLGADTVTQLTDSIVDAWRPSKTDDEVYEWYHPMTSARIRVEEVTGWGTEYEVSVKGHDADELESIVTVADERTAAMTVITHLKGMTDTRQ